MKIYLRMLGQNPELLVSAIKFLFHSVRQDYSVYPVPASAYAPVAVFLLNDQSLIEFRPLVPKKATISAVPVLC
jgi:hypothetical protein